VISVANKFSAVFLCRLAANYRSRFSASR
jgi:hypothetical protein